MYREYRKEFWVINMAQNSLDKYSTTPVGYKDYLRKQAQDSLKEIKPNLTPIDDAPPEMIKPEPIKQEADPLVKKFSNFIEEQQGSILGQSGGITQEFGKRNNIEVFSGGVNTGTDFAAPVGTKLALPPGQWVAVDAYDQDQKTGYIGNNSNKGYGNSVLFQNMQTGEKLRFSHLSNVGVKPGQVLNGGSVFGATGATGNVTGPHLDLEYYDQGGSLADVMRSLYADYLSGGLK